MKIVLPEELQKFILKVWEQKSVTAASGRTASLVLETPTIASIQTQTVETETEGTAGSGQQTGSTTGTAGSGQQTGGTTRVEKTTKDTTKSPARYPGS